MPSASSTKGSRYERRLRDTLDDLGFGVIRIGASGGGGDQDLPDILAGRPYSTVGLAFAHGPEAPKLDGGGFSHVWAIELKCGDGTTLYVDEDEVKALSRFATTFGAKALLAARFTTQGTPTDYYLVPPERARKTESGSYGLPVADIEDRASVTIHPGDDPTVEGEDG